MQAATNKIVEQKRVSISSKRQITIPRIYFEKLGFGSEAICSIEEDRLVIIPIERYSGEAFAEQILTDLIKEGFSGQELLKEFKARQAAVRPAVERMLEAASDAANGTGDYSVIGDVFGDKT